MDHMVLFTNVLLEEHTINILKRLVSKAIVQSKHRWERKKDFFIPHSQEDYNLLKLEVNSIKFLPGDVTFTAKELIACEPKN